VTRPTRAVVDLGAIARNYRFLAERASPARVIPVVKADAYGHGALAVARRLAAEGAATFGVAIAEEAVALRRAGVKGEILILGFAEANDVAVHRAYALTPSLYGLEQARDFSRATEGLLPPLPVHLKIDTGMGRLGFRRHELPDVIDLLKSSRGLSLAGVYSNLSSSAEPGPVATASQVAALAEAAGALSARGLAPACIHLANSGAVLVSAGLGFAAVRPGLALYGVAPAEGLDEGRLVPALTLETELMEVREVEAGTAIGYGGLFVAARKSRIGLLPLGYDDGLRRSLSGRVSVLVRGEEAPIVAAVSMDLTFVDLTGLSARRGDRVVCIGSDGGRRVTAWDWARAAGTIPWEILCGIGPRVPRTYTD
jgi:alanine racemase